MDRSAFSWGADPFASESAAPARSETIQLVGPHLRVHGTLSLARFNRISDLVNNSRGYIALSDARLMRRNGDPTDLVVPRLLVNPDEITFVAQSADEIAQVPAREPEPLDRPVMERVRREVVLFTSGHTLTGWVFMFPDTDFAAFVDSTDPRFLAMVDVTARSLADRRVISHFALALVNRTQIIAASMVDQAGQAAETGVQLD